MNTLPFNRSCPFIAPPTPRVGNWGAQSTRVELSRLTTKATVTDVPSVAQQRIMTQQAINVLTLQEKASFNTIHVPTKLMREASILVKFKHYANPMVYPVTGKTISSYKQLMNNLATAEVWQTAFGKDFGDMAQGNNKTGQRGTNTMFVMTSDEVAHTLVAGQFFTYANPVVNYRPQKRRSVPHPNHSRRQFAQILGECISTYGQP